MGIKEMVMRNGLYMAGALRKAGIPESSFYHRMKHDCILWADIVKLYRVKALTKEQVMDLLEKGA